MNRAWSRSVVGAGVMVLTMGSVPAWADLPMATGPEDAVDQTMVKMHAHPALEKLGRGLANIVSGWIEIPVNVNARYTKQDVPTSLITGILFGLVRGVARTGIGVYEAVTFFLPIPANFAPILPPLPISKGHLDDVTPPSQMSLGRS